MYTVHMEACSVNCPVAELLSRLDSVSWFAHVPRMRRFSRVFEHLSRLARPRRGRQILLSRIR